MKIYTLHELSDNLNYSWINKSLLKYHVQNQYWPKPFEIFHQFLFYYRAKLQTSFYEYNLLSRSKKWIAIEWLTLI